MLHNNRDSCISICFISSLSDYLVHCFSSQLGTVISQKMESVRTQPAIRIPINHSNKLNDLLTCNEIITGNSVDRLDGHDLINSATPLKLEKVDIRFEGRCFQVSLSTRILRRLNRPQGSGWECAARGEGDPHCGLRTMWVQICITYMSTMR